MRVTIQTPSGPRQLPDHACCYCVSRHSPQYVHPLPFELPDGTEMWLCPNTHHQANTLLKIYQQLGTPPGHSTQKRFTVFVQRLIRMWWEEHQEQQRLGDEAREEERQRAEEREQDEAAMEAFERVRRAVE